MFISFINVFAHFIYFSPLQSFLFSDAQVSPSLVSGIFFKLAPVPFDMTLIVDNVLAVKYDKIDSPDSSYCFHWEMVFRDHNLGTVGVYYSWVLTTSRSFQWMYRTRKCIIFLKGEFRFHIGILIQCKLTMFLFYIHSIFSCAEIMIFNMYLPLSLSLPPSLPHSLPFSLSLTTLLSYITNIECNFRLLCGSFHSFVITY